MSSTEGAERSDSGDCGSEDEKGRTAAFVTPAEHRRNRKSWSEEEKRAFWQRKRSEKKQRKKAHALVVKAAQQGEWDALSPEEKQRRRDEAMKIHEKRRAHEQQLATRCESSLANPSTPVIVFDLSFAWCMTVADTKSTSSQVQFSYGALKRDAFPLKPAITSLAGKEKGDDAHDSTAQAAVLGALSDFEGFRRYPPTVTIEEHWSEVFPKANVVFLTADAEDSLQDIEPGTVYIVGAFVDHNQHKGLTKDTAARHGVRAARLPISEHIDLSNRCKVLTINHVVEVLVGFMTNGRDWAAALEKVLPVRRTNQETLGSRKRRRVQLAREDPDEPSVCSGAEGEADSDG